MYSFCAFLAIIIKSRSFQNSSVNVISFCHTFRKEIGGLSSVMETQAVLKDICSSFGNITFLIKSMDNE